MSEIHLPPFAPVLLESMRSIGYSLESAIADLVDNSISAGSLNVRIFFIPYGTPYVAILDDGVGMTAARLQEAMRHGSRNPLEQRAENDLGRFGLGLKTSSLSQCRKLTVASLRKDGTLVAGCWDLDLIAKRKEWIYSVLDHPADIRKLPHVPELERQGHGTVVIWQSLDRLGVGESSLEAALGSKMERTREHLSVVFHRFLSAELGFTHLAISINNNPVAALDPFLSKHGATQRLQKEEFLIDGKMIRVQPFILPHFSKLAADELALAGGEEGLRRKQGFYVYRNRRLIIWGTWFKLARQKELSKLARVQVDIPNTLDHLWTLDIKKAGATPPEEVRINLGRILNKISEASRRTYTFRGRRTNVGGLMHAWDRVKGRRGIRYDINRKHPLIDALKKGLDEEDEKLLDLVFETLESTFPTDSLYADMADEKPNSSGIEDPEDSLREIARQLLSAVSPTGRDDFLLRLPKIEPFSNHPDITSAIIGELINAQ